MKLKEFDTVQLKDGRIGSIIEISEEFEDIIVTIGDGPENWEDIVTTKTEIDKVLETSE